MDSPEPIFNSSPPASPSATPTTASTHYSLAAARATESPPDYSTPDTDDTTTIAGTEKDNVQGVDRSEAQEVDNREDYSKREGFEERVQQLLDGLKDEAGIDLLLMTDSYDNPEYLAAKIIWLERRVSKLELQCVLLRNAVQNAGNNAWQNGHNTGLNGHNAEQNGG